MVVSGGNQFPDQPLPEGHLRFVVLHPVLAGPYSSIAVSKNQHTFLAGLDGSELFTSFGPTAFLLLCFQFFHQCEQCSEQALHYRSLLPWTHFHYCLLLLWWSFFYEHLLLKWIFHPILTVLSVLRKCEIVFYLYFSRILFQSFRQAYYIGS